MALLKRKFIWLVMLLLIGGAALQLRPKAEKSSDFYLNEAKEHLAQGDAASAVIQLKNSALLVPASPEPRLLLARTYLRTADYALAEKELRAAAERGTPEHDILLDLALAYLHQGKFHIILNEITPGERGPEIEGPIFSYRAQAYLGLGRSQEAETALRKAAKLAPESPVTLLGFAHLLRSRGDAAGAEHYVDRALAQDPRHEEALTLKGGLRRAAGDSDGALKAYDTALATNRTAVMARLGRAIVLTATDKIDSARIELDLLLTQAPRWPFAMYLKALLLSKVGQDQEATHMLRLTGDFVRSYPPALYLVAVLNVRQNQLEQAESNLRSLLNQLPGEPRATKMLASVLDSKGQTEAAIEVLEPLVMEDATDIDLTAMLATAYLRAGRPQDSARLFERVATERPDDLDARTRLALAHLQGGEMSTAIQELEKIVREHPDSLRSHVLLVLTKLRGNHLNEALAGVERLRAQFPDSPLPDNLRGGILVRKGDLAAARQSFEEALQHQQNFTPAMLNLAQLSLAAGKKNEAKQQYEKTLAVQPSNIFAMLGLSQIAFADRAKDDGVAWLKKAIETQPYSMTPRLQLVEYYMATKDFGNAIDEAQAAAKAMPDEPVASDALGQALLAGGQHASAVSAYRRLVELTPASPVAHQRLALALSAAESPAAARNVLERAIQIAPKYLPAYTSLASLSASQNDFAGALAVVDHMRQNFPDSAMPDVTAGDVYLQMAAHEKAILSYQTALARQKNSQTVIKLYQARKEAGQETHAVQGLLDWLNQYDSDVTVRFSLARHYLAAGELEKALKEHERLYRFVPDDPVLLNNLAWLYNRIGDPRGLELAQKLDLARTMSPAAKDTVGWILLRKGNRTRGLELIREAYEELPDNPEVLYHYAFAMNQIGQTTEAKNALSLIFENSAPHFDDIESARALWHTLQK